MTNESMIIMIKQNIDFPIYFLQILRSLLLLLLVLFYIEFESVLHLVCVCVCIGSKNTINYIGSSGA